MPEGKRSLWLTDEVVAAGQIEVGQAGARLEHNDVTCGAMTAVGVFVGDVQTGVPHGETFGSVWGV